MAKSDIIASLKLNSTDYEQKLAKAKASTKKFSQDSGSGLSDMMGKFKGLAVAVAGSKAAMEVFNAAIKSSQTIGDEYTRVIESAKGSVGEFVYAMANADFSGFNDGLRGVISNAREAASAMDSLGNAQISFDYLTAGYRSDFKTSMGIAKDKSLSLGERQSAYDAALVSLDKIGEAVKVYTDKTVAAVVANAKAKGNNIDASFITRDNIDRIFALDITAGGEEEKARLAERYKEFKKLKSQEEKLEKAVSVARLNGYDSEAKYAQRLAEVRAKIHSDDYQMAALYNAMLVKGTDEWLKGLADLVVKADNANAAYQELKTSSLEVANQLNQPIKAGTVGEAITKKLTGEQYAQSFGVNYYNTLGNTLAGKASQGYIPIQSVPIISDDIIEESLPQVAAQAAKVAEESYSAAEGIYSISNALGNLSGMMDDNTAKWVSWGASMLGAVGQFVQAINGGGGLSLLSPASALLSSFVGMPMGGASRNNEIRLRVQGSDLVGSINNYNSINSRRY